MASTTIPVPMARGQRFGVADAPRAELRHTGPARSERRCVMLADVLSLTSDESDAYRILVSVPSSSPAELAQRAGGTVDAAAAVLAELERRGMATRSLGNTARFVAVPPSSAIKSILEHRQQALHAAEVELDELESIYRASTLGAGPVDVVQMVRGAEEIRHRLHQLQLAARREVVSFVKAPVSVVTGAENTAEGAAVARGVQYRAILERAMLDEEPELFHEIVDAQAAGEQVRLIDRLPLKLVIVDREVAFLPLIGDSDPATTGAIVVRQSALLDGLVALFEAKWEQSIPVVTAADAVHEAAAGGIDDLDTRILSLLLTGLTDQAVALKAETSLRTVQRRIRYLMDRTGADTRLQLGYHAARMGWV